MSVLSSLLFAGLMSLPAPVAVPASDAPRADQVRALAPLRALIRMLDDKPGLMLSIGHAGGDAGSARAGQLRAVLVALGLSSARIVLAPQSLDEPVLIVSLTPAGAVAR